MLERTESRCEGVTELPNLWMKKKLRGSGQRMLR